jgi:hypothetical protein
MDKNRKCLLCGSDVFGERRKYCHECSPPNSSTSKRVTSMRKAIKKMAIYLLGGECLLCGYNKHQNSLVFHHLDPSSKTSGIGSLGYLSTENTLIEIKKCALLCHNCHSEVHGENIKIKIPKGYYDKCNLKLKELNNHFKNTCVNCGTEIDYKATRCKDCHVNNVRSRRLNKPSKEDLEVLIYNKPFTEIGRMYGVSDNTIRKWCKAYGLPFRKKDMENE